MKLGIDGRYISDHFPGIARYTFNLVDALARIAPQQTFTLLYNPALTDTRFGVAKLGRYSNVELVKTDVPTFSPAEQWKLPLLIRALSLDVLHSPYYIKPYRLPCASIVTVHDLIPLLFPEHSTTRARLFFRWATTLALRAAYHVIAVSEATRQDLLHHFRVPGERISVIPEAADPAFYPCSPAKVAALRRKYGLPEQYLLYLGINKPHKNLVRLIDAFSRITHHVSHFTLVIAGTWDPRYPEPKWRANELGLENAVRFLGPVPEEDLPALYTGAVLFVFPSLYEGFGLPVLEATACGTPVVCSNTSSLPEIVDDAALTFDPLNVTEMAARIGEALREEVLREEMGKKGMRRAKFSWERTARETLEVYRRVVSH